MTRLIVFILALFALPATAQERRPSHCIALADAAPGMAYVQRASFGTPLPDHTVRLSFAGHATFVIETPGGLVAATDYTGFIGPTARLPDVVTMNNAHETHFTAFPDPDIPHVLQGWADRTGAPADHHVDLGEMLVRNVPTDVRGFDRATVRPNGNSIFVFEVAGLCIGHLGHLHHEPTPEQYAALGRLDVVMAPVDGGLTLDLSTMIRVLTRLRSSVVIPMHWFGQSSLERFLAGISDAFAVERPGTSSLEVSLRSLPSRPTVVVLQPRGVRDPDL
ncbi:MBL fold metallo-hydrolase [Rhodovulum adriaticum]|uniref:L-ascorbate metabolism protein UlaG (Beta-lactamase superfamily) n=1 Tax=Rhodovulum adriaticum TaxID=35804 RepID=A0A4R2NM87_RHOAD|nr:MBL fold metallo-hydrolase [Rhodovulum adriaticum]MBK1636830.1 Zn-dependent hydrolase [Rhodovulum adriaticum]TCP22717.1 L-ascorbate metabolism protein UlaG (beta-lactamase superfamily) [Rhodovulum adriaticum]